MHESVESEWERYGSLYKNASPAQMKELKRTFYAGFLVSLTVMKWEPERNESLGNEAIAFLESLIDVNSLIDKNEQQRHD